jgi:hypothetical protein
VLPAQGGWRRSDRRDDRSASDARSPGNDLKSIIIEGAGPLPGGVRVLTYLVRWWPASVASALQALVKGTPVASQSSLT